MILHFFDLFDYDRCDRSKPTAPRRFRVETRSSRENREGNRSIGKALLDSARCCWYGSSRARIARLHANRIARFSTLRYKWCKMLGVYRVIGVSPTTWKRNINLINRYSFDIRSSGNSVFRSGTKRTNFPLLYVEMIRNDN